MFSDTPRQLFLQQSKEAEDLWSPICEGAVSVALGQSMMATTEEHTDTTAAATVSFGSTVHAAQCVEHDLANKDR